MKTIFSLLAIFSCTVLFAQSRKIDSLTQLLKKATTDTAKINLQNAISSSLLEIDLNSAIANIQQTLAQSKYINYKKGEATARRLLAVSMCNQSRFSEANEELQQAETIYATLSDSLNLAKVYSTYGLMYGMQSKYDSSIIYFKKNIVYTEHLTDKSQVGQAYQNLAINYQMQSDFRQAIFYQNKALQNAEAAHDANSLAYIYYNMADTYVGMNNEAKAEQYDLKAIAYAKIAGIKNVELYAYAGLSSIYFGLKNNAKSYDYAMKAVQLGRQTGDLAITATGLSRAALALAQQNQFAKAEQLDNEAILLADSTGQPLNKFQTLAAGGYINKLQNKYAAAISLYERGFAHLQQADTYTSEIAIAYKQLSECYEATGRYDKALSNFKQSAQIKDSVSSRENIRKATELSMNYDFDKKQQAQQAAKEKDDRENKIWLIFIVAFLFVFIVLSTIALIAYKREQKGKSLLNIQKTEIESTLLELKATQAQLIQAEKMASLGELTAGIAHEIQNPLNFVNNFSELNKELLEELKEEVDKGNLEDVKTLATDVIENEVKINHHGKRADAIVKGMLQHSRQTKGVKEPTDLNALCDEYLRLSFHGLRAKDKSFNADFVTDFDENMGKIKIVPQDMGRVLLNLFNNAFYAVNEKKKVSDQSYKPLVSVQTKKKNNNIEIVIKDNGSGIPKTIVDKIFQPFFTTKPTGEGTGLGLSISYDIITKEHNGTINVESKEGDGTTFTIVI